ncbi:MAG: hypothetical protein FJX91_08525, partial [Bacteroidetes bacterium]|nr:hypothetical protein [Bacteroidota bacterium]
MKRFSIIISLSWMFLFSSSNWLNGQAVPLGMPFFDDAIRRAQLMGLVDQNNSFMIRPVQPQRSLGLNWTWDKDTSLYSGDTNTYGQFTQWTDKKNQFRIELLPVQIQLRYNGHHPYGWADGPMVPAKGMQQYASGGIYLKAKWLEAQLRPELV